MCAERGVLIRMRDQYHFAWIGVRNLPWKRFVPSVALDLWFQGQEKSGQSVECARAWDDAGSNG
jgi:hypothetical protein